MSDIRSLTIGRVTEEEAAKDETGGTHPDNGRTYKMVVMSPWEGAPYAAKVSSLLAGALADEAGEAHALASLEGGAVSDDLIARTISMVTRMIPHLDPDQFSELAKTAFTKSQVTAPGGNELSEEGLFNEWFGKHRADFFPVAIWAIKENCAGFFVGGGAGWSALAGQLLPSKSLKTE